MGIASEGAVDGSRAQEDEMDGEWQRMPEVLKRLLGISSPQDNNPKSYARHVQIVDDTALLMHAEFLEKTRRVERAETEYRAAMQDLEAIKARMFMRLEDAYPAIQTKSGEGGNGVRVHEEKLYYVSWD
jgi:hypothetical protein